MHWTLTWRADPEVAAMADRHYSRKTPGAAQFTPPGRVLVLKTPTACWATSWPRFGPEVEWKGGLICTLFRNEGDVLSSELIREALAATRWTWPDSLEHGMWTFIDPRRVRSRNPGYCFKAAGFERFGLTKSGHVVLAIDGNRFPDPIAPLGAQFDLLREADG